MQGFAGERGIDIERFVRLGRRRVPSLGDVALQQDREPVRLLRLRMVRVKQQSGRVQQSEERRREQQQLDSGEPEARQRRSGQRSAEEGRDEHDSVVAGDRRDLKKRNIPPHGDRQVVPREEA